MKERVLGLAAALLARRGAFKGHHAVGNHGFVRLSAEYYEG